jgi:membrane protein
MHREDAAGQAAGRVSPRAQSERARDGVRALVDVWIEAFSRHNLLTTASAISFQMLTATAALLLLGLSLLGAFGLQGVWEHELAPPIADRLPPVMWNAIALAVERVLRSSQAPLIAFAVAITVWEVSGAVRAVMGALNAVYGSEERRGFWHRFALSFALAAAIAALIITAVLAVTAAHGSIAAWGLPAALVEGLRWLVALVLLSLAVTLLVRFAPVDPRPLRWVSAGSLTTVAGWVLASLAFRLYVTSVVSFRSPTGVLAAVLVLSGYLYTSAIVFLVGVELNRMLENDASEHRFGLLGRVRAAAGLRGGHAEHSSA